MDEIWNYVINNFNKCLPYIPYYDTMINNIVNLNFCSNPNLLLYGAKGFAFELIWETILQKKFGKYKKTKCIWQKDITYYETPYFFEVDLLYPHQTKDMAVFSEFIKDLITHPCIHEDRHIIVLKSIDELSNRQKTIALRVLLERYSKNAFFICTTSHVSALENPLLSRFLLLRCPIFTPDEMENCFKVLNLTYHPLLKEVDNYDFYYSLYISWFIKNHPNEITLSICQYKLPCFHEFLLSIPLNYKIQTETQTETETNIKKSSSKKQPSKKQILKKDIEDNSKIGPSIEEIRKVTQKICVHNGTFSMILHDLLLFYKDSNDINKMYIIYQCSKIDHICSTTEEYRKPLYVEYLLHTIFFSNNKILE